MVLVLGDRRIQLCDATGIADSVDLASFVLLDTSIDALPNSLG